MPTSPFGSHVLKLTKSRGWTRQDLVISSGITKTTLGRILTDQEPSPSQIARLAKALEVPPSSLLLVLGVDIDPVPDIEPDVRRIAEIIRGMPELAEIFEVIAGLSSNDLDLVKGMLQTLRHRHRDRRRRNRPRQPDQPGDQ